MQISLIQASLIIRTITRVRTYDVSQQNDFFFSQEPFSPSDFEDVARAHAQLLSDLTLALISLGSVIVRCVMQVVKDNGLISTTRVAYALSRLTNAGASQRHVSALICSLDL